MITFTYVDDEGEEIEASLPSCKEVCPRCEGTGFHLTESIGSYAYSQEEFEEAFDDEESRSEYFRRGGRFDVVCTECKGKNVIDVVDEEACITTEQKAILCKYDDYLNRQAQYRAEEEAERRAGC
jgi:RecJ-like exonuclease